MTKLFFIVSILTGAAAFAEPQDFVNLCQANKGQAATSNSVRLVCAIPMDGKVIKPTGWDQALPLNAFSFDTLNQFRIACGGQLSISSRLTKLMPQFDPAAPANRNLNVESSLIISCR